MPETLSADVVTGSQKPKEPQTPVMGKRSIAASAALSAERPGSIALKRSELVHGATTGEKVRFERPLGADKLEGRDLTVTIKPETVQKYSHFLDTYVTNLGKLAELPAPTGQGNMLEYVLQDADRKTDKLLLDFLSEQKIGADGKTITRIVNQDKITQYLQSEDSWAVTTQLMEQYALMTELGLGIDVVIRNQKYNRQKDESRIERKVTTDTSPTLAAGLNATLRGAWLAIQGATHLAVFPGKSKLVFTSDADIVQAMQSSSPEQKAYLKTMIGVDLDRISVVDKKIKYADGYQPHLKTFETNIANMYSARKEFFQQLGLDRAAVLNGRIDASRDILFPEEYIFTGRNMADKATKPEGLPVRYHMEIMEEYNKNSPGSDKYTRLDAMAKARQTVMLRYLERQMSVKLQEEARQKDRGSVSALKEKRDYMKANPEVYRKEQRDRHEKTIAEATRRKNNTAEKRRQLLEGEDNPARKEVAVVTQERELVREFDLSVDIDIDTAIKTKTQELQQLVSDAFSELTTAQKAKGQEIKDLVTATVQQYADARNNLAQSIAAHGSPKGGINIQDADISLAIAPALEVIKEAHDTTISSLNQSYEEAQSELKRLKEQARSYQNAVNERDTATHSIAAREPGQFNATEQSLTDMLSTGIAIDAVRTTSVADLMARISGTEEEKLQVASQAKAAAESAQIALPDYQTDAIAQLKTANISQDEIFRSRKELKERLKNYYTSNLPAGGTPPTDQEIQDQIEAAYLGTGKQLVTLTETKLTNEIGYYDGLISAERKALDSLGNFTRKVEEIDITIALMGDQSQIYSRAYAAEEDPQQLQRLTSATPIDISDQTYSEAERNLGEAEFVYSWYRLLYPEYVNAKNRDELFESIRRILPPDKLRDLLTSVPADITTGPGMQQATKTLINYCRDLALAA